MNQTLSIHKKTVELSKQVLRMTTEAGSGHASSGLSLAHIVSVLMYKVMRHDPRNPWNPRNDRLVLSEGHAVPIVYAAYADLGGACGSSPDKAQFLHLADLGGLRHVESCLDGHPNPSAGFPFFDTATGSLGQGLSHGCGLALAARRKNIQKRIYVIVGDGESREGQVWEATDFLVENNLHEVVPIFNCNGLGQSEAVSGQQNEKRLSAKLSAFGFTVIRIDGHDPDQIENALRTASEAQRPHAIVAKTVKGWVVREFQRKNYHGKTLKESMLPEAMSDLESVLVRFGASDADDTGLKPPSPEESVPAEDKTIGRLGAPDFASLLKGDPHQEDALKRVMSTRRAYGLALRELGRVDPRIVALDGDVKNSTYSQYFADAYPDRFFEARIAEQNMISAAVGLAAGGSIPFVSSFGKFLVRAYDQIEMGLIAQAPVKICGSHSGASIGADGPSQMGLTDVAFFSALANVHRRDGTPGVAFFNPSCAVAAYKCVQKMVDHPGAAYLRTIRSDLPMLYSPDEEFELGVSKTVLPGKDFMFVGAGYMVHVCIRAAELLAEDGITAGVIDCWSLPLRRESIPFESTRLFVTVEDNYGNGTGSAIAAAAAERTDGHNVVKQIYVDRIPRSGISPEEALRFVGLSPERIATVAKENLQSM